MLSIPRCQSQKGGVASAIVDFSITSEGEKMDVSLDLVSIPQLFGFLVLRQFRQQLKGKA